MFGGRAYLCQALPVISRNAMSYSPEDVSGRWKLGRKQKRGRCSFILQRPLFKLIRNVYLRQLLTDVQDMVADALKIGEHFRIKHAGLIRTEAVPDAVHLVLAVPQRHVVNFLFCGCNLGKPFYRNSLQVSEQVQGLSLIHI